MLDAIEHYRALGLRMVAAVAHFYLAQIELHEGNADAALALLLEADKTLAEAGEHSYRSTIQAYLGQAYDRLGHRDIARAALALSDHLGASTDVVNHAITHAVRARRALADGDAKAAERWDRSAVKHAFQTDFAVLQGDSKLELARILAALGREQGATSEAHAALKLYEAKRDRPGAGEAQALLDELDVPP